MMSLVNVASFVRPLRQRRNSGGFARGIAVCLALVAALAFVGTARADSEIVVAIRYLTATGTSHAHLFLYREDGKLLRQLTKDDSGQDRNPQFAPDGETIVFTRVKPKAPPEYWTVRPRGGSLARLATAPGWYKPADSSPYFTNIETNTSTTSAEAATPTYRSPDGAVEIVLRVPPDDPNKDINGPGTGSHYLLRDLKTGHEVEMGKLPGYLGVDQLLHLRQDPGVHFLLEKGLRLAFFGLHLDSTDGDTVYALDLTNPRLINLSHNWAAPFPLPGESAFLTLTEVRYVPIAGSKMTANSSCVERRDAAFHTTRFAHEGAARTYGASIYRPGRLPAVVTIRAEHDD